MKIGTLTLNPAFDLHCEAKDFALYHETLADVTSREIGGKGINISRALKENGVDSTAVLILGADNGAEFETAVKREGLPCFAVTVPGRIRENVTVHSDGKETRISFRGFRAGEETLRAVEDRLSDFGDGDVVTLTGRNPDGLSVETVKAFCRRLQSRGVKIVIDSRSFSLSDIVEVAPWLIKPNEEEISAYLGRQIRDFEEVRSAARSLHEGGIENVMVSLGEKGAYLCCPEGEFRVPAPVVNVLSTIGAGDSSIAGFLAAAAEGKTGPDCLRRAVAFGSAACITPGTKPPRPEDVAALYPLIQSKNISGDSL
ncbi:MAG: 1-phosphofructokinase family hexose kinase [Clostridia bacterium]|nr:1-phosphofructokinase family hexose kinase [Clostridia bacterium]